MRTDVAAVGDASMPEAFKGLSSAAEGALLRSFSSSVCPLAPPSLPCSISSSRRRSGPGRAVSQGSVKAAMPSKEKLAKKEKYFNKLIDLCVNTPNALLVGVDHVASKQMQDIRMDLRGKAVVLMGKNTMIRRALQVGHDRHPEAGLEKLRDTIQGNMGFIFATNCIHRGLVHPGRANWHGPFPDCLLPGVEHRHQDREGADRAGLRLQDLEHGRESLGQRSGPAHEVGDQAFRVQD
eukprot:s755_g22.t1